MPECTATPIREPVVSSKSRPDLWGVYRAAFKAWTVQTRRQRRILEAAPEGNIVIGATGLTTGAEAGYREARNRLTEEMAPAMMTAGDAEDQRILKIQFDLGHMEDGRLKEFFEACEQFCAAAHRRGEHPPVFFAQRRRLAEVEMTRRAAPSSI